jgi:hypothetical protein
MIPNNPTTASNPTSTDILIPVGFRGLAGWCTGWAGDELGTVYAAFIGRTTALTGIWAAFQDDEVLKLLDRPDLRKRPKLEGARYHTLRAKLPESGWQHLVLLHSQATPANLAGLDFYVIGENPKPPLERFWTQWNSALPLPAAPAWVSALWQRGTLRGLITPCEAEDIYCWHVQADVEAWQEILQQIVRRR